MKRASGIAGIALVLSMAAPCFGGDRIGIGIKGGTLGAGVDLTGRVFDWLSVRGTANAIDVSRSYSETDIDYDGDFKLGAYGVWVDFHPLKGNFRLTAGLMKNRNKFDLTARPKEDVEIGDTTYTPGEVGTLDGTIEFKRTVPYVGIGFGSAAKAPGRIRFLLDVGAIQQGSGDVSITSSNSLVAPADLRKEEAEVEDDIGDYKWWPVLAFGISIRI